MESEHSSCVLGSEGPPLDLSLAPRPREMTGLKKLIKEISGTLVRYGHCRIHVPRRREGWGINAKRACIASPTPPCTTWRRSVERAEHAFVRRSLVTSQDRLRLMTGHARDLKSWAPAPAALVVFYRRSQSSHSSRGKLRGGGGSALGTLFGVR